jgi:hypothetical protein
MGKFTYSLPMTSPVDTGPPTAASLASHQRDTGLRLDGGRLRHEFRVRGLTAGRVADLANMSPNTLTRALAGDPISERTLRSIVRVLADLPMLPGATDLVAGAPIAHPESVVGV